MLKAKIEHLAALYHPRVVALRRKIHAHPELSWQETETSKLVAEELMRCGIEVQTRVAKNGVVGILKGQEEGPCIALRADMDALPIQESSDKEYCSVVPGVMHGCGHDAHTANLLGVAMILAELRSELKGMVKFIFQPSEEKIPSGADAMIKAGVLKNPDVQAILGLHVSPEIEAGKIGFCSGRFMASSDEIYLTIVGKGGHAARIEDTKNPLLIASEILLALKHITDLQVPIVLSFGKIEGKGATNVIPDTVEIAGTLRCFDEQLRFRVHQRITEICEQIAEKYLCQAHVNILQGYPVLVNNDKLTNAAAKLAEAYLNSGRVLTIPTRMGSEDFAYYTHHVPACFYRLGTGNKTKGITSGLHTPGFDIDEDALQLSTGVMSYLALEILRNFSSSALSS